MRQEVAAARLLHAYAPDIQSFCHGLGRRAGAHFVEPGVKVNGQYYRDTLLLEGLLPEIRTV